MKLDKNHIDEWIDRYLDGQLNSKETKEFEKLLADDEQVQQALNDEQQLRAIVEDHALMAWEANISSEMRRAKKHQFLKRTTLIALLIASIGVGAYVLLHEEPKSNGREITPEKITEEVPSFTNDSEPEVQNESKAKKPVVNPIIKADTTQDTLIHDEQSLDVDTIVDAISPPSKKEKTDTTLALDTLTSVSPYLLEEGREEPPCEQNPTIVLVSQATCEGEAQGSIVIEQTSLAAYSASLLPDGIDFENARIENLQEGQYIVRFIDDNNCKYDKDITIDVKDCYEPEKGFNPDFETWVYELKGESEAVVTIYDKRGRLLLRKNVEAYFEWDGTDRDGSRVPVASYIYIIEKNGVLLKKGQVSVIY